MQLAALLDRLTDDVRSQPDTHDGVDEPSTTQLGSGIPCRENDAELWFADRPVDVEFAKSLCGACPAQTACLAGALERREPWGVWGGELFEGGIVVPRKRPRGRPRKDDPRYTDDPRFMNRASRTGRSGDPSTEVGRSDESAA